LCDSDNQPLGDESKRDRARRPSAAPGFGSEIRSSRRSPDGGSSAPARRAALGQAGRASCNRASERTADRRKQRSERRPRSLPTWTSSGSRRRARGGRSRPGPAGGMDPTSHPKLALATVDRAEARPPVNRGGSDSYSGVRETPRPEEGGPVASERFRACSVPPGQPVECAPIASARSLAAVESEFKASTTSASRPSATGSPESAIAAPTPLLVR
jgi:hypothetical protein